MMKNETTKENLMDRETTPSHMLLRLIQLAELLEGKMAVEPDCSPNSQVKPGNVKNNQEKPNQIVQFPNNLEINGHHRRI